MKKNLSSRDLTQLSAYLDGELSASASAKMKSRLARDPNLAAALDDLRDTKNILRRIPKRRAPRSFALSPQMVAARPPVPRLVPVLNYASILAIFLFFISFIPPIGLGGMAAPAPEAMMEVAEPAMMEEAPAEEMPAEEVMEEAVAEEPAAAEEAPAEEAPTEEPPVPMAAEPAAEEPAGEEVVEGENAMGAAATVEPTARSADDVEKSAADQETDEITVAPTLPTAGTLVAEFTATPSIEEMPEIVPAASLSQWQKILLLVIILFPVSAYILRRAVIEKWKKASK
jgi:anti-sigma factor RsiW